MRLVCGLRAKRPGLKCLPARQICGLQARIHKINPYHLERTVRCVRRNRYENAIACTRSAGLHNQRPNSGHNNGLTTDRPWGPSRASRVCPRRRGKPGVMADSLKDLIPEMKTTIQTIFLVDRKESCKLGAHKPKTNSASARC